MKEEKAEVKAEEILITNNDALENIINYYLINGNGLNTTNTIKLLNISKTLAIHLCSIVGAFGYLKPARDFAGDNKVHIPFQTAH